MEATAERLSPCARKCARVGAERWRLRSSIRHGTEDYHRKRWTASFCDGPSRFGGALMARDKGVLSSVQEVRLRIWGGLYLSRSGTFPNGPALEGAGTRDSEAPAATNAKQAKKAIAYNSTKVNICRLTITVFCAVLFSRHPSALLTCQPASVSAHHVPGRALQGHYAKVM